MSSLLLDAGPLGHLAAVARPQWNWPAATLHVVRQVADEAGSSDLSRRLLVSSSPQGAWIRQHDLVVGSPAQRMYTERLRPRTSHATKNAGEDASIALLAHELTDGVFVTMDGKAALAALVELGPGRVVSPFDCWRWLHGRGHIDAVTLAQLDERTSRNLGLASPPPRLDPRAD